MVLQQPLISLIAAMADNGAIGRDNQLPWRMPDDLKRFKSLTLGKTVLMGRKTFESIGKPLTDRTNLVMTRDPAFRADGVIVVHSLGQALGRAQDAEELVAIGGAEIYRLLMPFARRLYLTLVHAEIPGDTFFPDFDPTQWADVECRNYPADARNPYPFSFLTLERKSAPEAPGVRG